ncbi:MAG: hypothetical protein QXK12_08840 [Candidatus Nezhaarchaeales archaeon]
MEVPPDYFRVLSARRRYVKQLVKYLAEARGEAKFTDLLKALGNPPKSTLSNNLDVLIRLGVAERRGRGLIRLRFKTPLCLIANADVPAAYLGLLGLRDQRRVSETETAVKLLEGEGWKIEKVKVVTTLEAAGSWRNYIPSRLQSRIEWHTLAGDVLDNIQLIEQQVEPILTGLMKEYTVIVDCTSGTRPAGIAYYRLASKWSTPLIYVYEQRQKLAWLISREDLKQRIPIT